jgi:hypothetical protein
MGNLPRVEVSGKHPIVVGMALPKNAFNCLERFSNWYSLTYFIEGDFFLRKKPLSLLASVYSYWRTALVVSRIVTRGTRVSVHRFCFLSRSFVVRVGLAAIRCVRTNLTKED